MPDTGRDPLTGKMYPGVSGSQSGPLAGQDAHFAGLNQQQLEQQFLTERGWAGLANKKRPPEATWRPLFEQWKAAKLKPAPSPSPSPTPGASPVIVGDESALPNALAGLFG